MLHFSGVTLPWKFHEVNVLGFSGHSRIIWYYSVISEIETDDRTALVCKPRTKGGNSDLPSAGFNVINSIIGSGIIGLPYSMKEAGFPLGVLLLVGVAYITDYSIILLIKGGNLSGTNSYQELVNKSYGFIGYLILSILQFLYPFIGKITIKLYIVNL
uniref:Putative sodium-coupled neutral amino acid transporter 11 n=1 Tax=Chrysemys picta bellii TaxID=8478 RepID=A0A8C3ISN7_CHRPI